MESCVATAYTIRYPNENTGLGPAEVDVVSVLNVRPIGSDEGGGGGSMTDGVGEGLERGSGSDGMGSSADEVSIVICFVIGGDVLRV